MRENTWQRIDSPYLYGYKVETSNGKIEVIRSGASIWYFFIHRNNRIYSNTIPFTNPSSAKKAALEYKA